MDVIRAPDGLCNVVGLAMRLRILAAALCFFAGRALAATPDLTGDWRGEWIKDDDALPVVLTFTHSGEGYTDALNADALQVAEMPLGRICDAKGRVHFEVEGDGGSTVFDGVIESDRRSGGFVDHELNTRGPSVYDSFGSAQDPL